MNPSIKISHLILPDHIKSIGVIADIHSNMPALESVIEDGHARGVDLWLSLGDLVNYYINPNEVCKFLSKNKVYSVLGNHDAFALGIINPPPGNSNKYRLDWTRSNISRQTKDFLSNMPFGLIINIPSGFHKKILAFHASPRRIDEYLYTENDLKGLELNEDEILFVGHTHIPMHHPCGKGTVANPGSVGQPRNWNPGASYAIYSVETGKCNFLTTKYDYSKYQQQLRDSGVAEDMVNMLSRSKN